MAGIIIRLLPRYKKLSGFTILELLLVIAIIAILAVGAAPFYSRFIVQNNVSTASDQFAASLRKAQNYAMASKDNSSWEVNYNGGSRLLSLERSSDHLVSESYTVVNNVTVNIISGSLPLIYTKMTGIPSGTLQLNVSGGNSNRSINVNSQGVVSAE